MYYKDFVDFVKWNAENNQLASDVTLLDVGCGNGWSTHCLAASGFHSVGVDLNPDAFEAPVSQNFSLQFASATALPFPDSHFDIISCYQCLEHVPNPELALDEMRRVCKPSGLILIVGPNLLNPLPVIPGDQTKGHRIVPKLTLFGVVSTPCMVSGQESSS